MLNAPVKTYSSQDRNKIVQDIWDSYNENSGYIGMSPQQNKSLIVSKGDKLKLYMESHTSQLGDYFTIVSDSESLKKIPILERVELVKEYDEKLTKELFPVTIPLFGKFVSKDLEKITFSRNLSF